MNNELEALLQTKTSPERAAILRDVANVLEEMSLYNHFVEIENLISLEEQIDPAQLMNEVEGVLLTGLTTVLSNFSIFTTSTDVEILLSIVKGLRDLEEYEDFETVLTICDSDSTDEERLAELMELVTSFVAEDYLPVLDGVSFRLVEKTRQLFAEKDDQDVGDLVEDSNQAIIKRLKSFKPQFDIAIFAEIENGFPVGMEPAMVFGRVEDRLFDLSAEETAEEAYAAALATNALDEDVVSVAKDHVQELFEDANFVADVNIAINDVSERTFYG